MDSVISLNWRQFFILIYVHSLKRKCEEINSINHNILYFLGLATGTLLYVIFFEVLSKDRSGLVQYVAVLVGFLIMLGLQFIGKFQFTFILTLRVSYISHFLFTFNLYIIIRPFTFLSTFWSDFCSRTRNLHESEGGLCYLIYIFL